MNHSSYGKNRPVEKKPPLPERISYYRDGKIDPDLMDSRAEEIAKDLQNVASSQLRRFYDDVLNLQLRIKAASGQGRNEEQAFQSHLADFKMLKAKAMYSNGRSEKIFPRALLQFVIDHVHSVANYRDFAVFCKHFQAVVAFHKFYQRAKD